MKIAVTGGLGFTGRSIVPSLIEMGHDVTVFGRQEEKLFPFDGACYVRSDLSKPGTWQKYIPENEVIINLAGVNIFQRWNEEKKKNIYDSRVNTTRNIIDAIPENDSESRVLINASAVGYYGDRGDLETPETAPPGGDFLSKITGDWEREALKAEDKGLRVVLLRLGTVLGPDGGAFPQLRKTFSWFIGARLGSGKQWFPWIHIDDVVAIVRKSLEDSKMRGAFNCVAPQTVTNGTLTSVMSEVTGRPVIIPFVPGFMLRLIFGEFGSFLTKGQKTIPLSLEKSGYSFKYPELKQALYDLVHSQE